MINIGSPSESLEELSLGLGSALRGLGVGV